MDIYTVGQIAIGVMASDEIYLPQDPERYKKIMGKIWHEPNSDNYWIGYYIGTHPSICLLNVGKLLDYFIEYDPEASLIELQKIINDFSTLATLPENITDDWTRNQVYEEIVGPVAYANRLHECIEMQGSLTQLYDKEMRGMAAPYWDSRMGHDSE